MADTVTRRPLAQGEPHVRGVASIATALGFGATTAAASCCVLPLALASIGAGGGLTGSLAGLASIRTPLLVLSAVALVVAWIIWWRKREAACTSTEGCATYYKSRRASVLLNAATALVGLAAVWDSIEPTLMKWIL